MIARGSRPKHSQCAFQVPAVIKLSEVPNKVVQNRVAVFLCNLSHDTRVARTIVEQQAVPTLISLGHAGNADTQRRCAAALRNLSAVPEVHALIMKQGAVSALLALMKTKVRTQHVRRCSLLACLTARIPSPGIFCSARDYC